MVERKTDLNIEKTYLHQFCKTNAEDTKWFCGWPLFENKCSWPFLVLL